MTRIQDLPGAVVATNHVGNLEYYVSVTYVADTLPPDAEDRTVQVFRDLVRTSVSNYERVDDTD